MLLKYLKEFDDTETIIRDNQNKHFDWKCIFYNFEYYVLFPKKKNYMLK